MRVNGAELDLVDEGTGIPVAILPGVTHFMSYQAPEQFNQLVLAFLDTHVAHPQM